jgi:hypothetical protein
VALLVVVLAWGLGLGLARAEENLDQKKTPAQLYASDCAECHRNPKLVGKTMAPGALAGYLRAHYTASKESAATLAAYLNAMAAPPQRAAAPKAPALPNRAPAPSAAKASPDAGKGLQYQAVPSAGKAGEASPNSSAKPAEPIKEPKAAPAEAPPAAASANVPKPADTGANSPPSGDAPH